MTSLMLILKINEYCMEFESSINMTFQVAGYAKGLDIRDSGNHYIKIG